MELVVAVGIGSLVLAALASLTFFGARGSLAIVNYADLDGKSRYALDVIGRELRQATALLSFETNLPVRSLTLTNGFEGTVISLVWDSDARTLTLSKSGDPAQVCLYGCDRWDFALYQRTGEITPTNILFFPATNHAGQFEPGVCKLINMSWRCSRPVFLHQINTESIQSAQIVLRNKIY